MKYFTDAMSLWDAILLMPCYFDMLFYWCDSTLGCLWIDYRRKTLLFIFLFASNSPLKHCPLYRKNYQCYVVKMLRGKVAFLEKEMLNIIIQTNIPSYLLWCLLYGSDARRGKLTEKLWIAKEEGAIQWALDQELWNGFEATLLLCWHLESRCIEQFGHRTNG